MKKIKFISNKNDWTELLGFISNGKITPVIGQEIFKYKDDEKLSDLESQLIKLLFEKFNITDNPSGTLVETVNYLLIEKNIETIEIIEFLDQTIKEFKPDFPLLRLLLKISDFKFLINTTVFYDILKNNIIEVRKEEPDFKNFSPLSQFTFEKNPKNLSKSLVFNVSGSLEEYPALSEDDMLEFTSKLGEKINNSSASNLLNVLQNDNLLFLGCSYPEWLTRFALRHLTSQALSEWGNGKPRRKIYVINDNTEINDDRNKFLNNKSVITFQGGTKEFINELSLLWKEKFEKPKSIFLSYTRGDQEAVENLKKGLEQAGNIKCWYDKEDLDYADKWRDEIITEINKADLFIPLISNNSLDHLGFVKNEWDAAYTIYVAKGKTGDYIIPIVVDDTNPYDTRVPKDFTELNIGKIPNGNPDEKFLNSIKKMLDLA